MEVCIVSRAYDFYIVCTPPQNPTRPNFFLSLGCPKNDFRCCQGQKLDVWPWEVIKGQTLLKCSDYFETFYKINKKSYHHEYAKIIAISHIVYENRKFKVNRDKE